MDKNVEIPDDVCQVASAEDNADEDESWACYQSSEGESTIKAALHISSYTDYDIELSNRTDTQWTTSGDLNTESNQSDDLTYQTNQSDALSAANNQTTELKPLSNDSNFKSIQPDYVTTSGFLSGNFQDVENQSNNSNTICEASNNWNTVDNPSSDLNMVGLESKDLNIVENQCNVLINKELKTDENQISDLNIVGQQSSDLNIIGNQCKNLNNVGNQCKNQCNDLNYVGNQCYDLNNVGNQCNDLNNVGNQCNNLNNVGNQCNDLNNVGNQCNDLNYVGNQCYDLNNVGNQCYDLNNVGNQCNDLNNVGNQCKDVNNIGTQCNDLNNVGNQCNDLNNVGNQCNDLNNVGNQCNDLNNVGNQCKDVNNMGNQCNHFNSAGIQCNDLNNVGNHFNDVNTEGNQCNDLNTMGIQCNDLITVGNQCKELNTKKARINALRNIKTRHRKKKWSIKGSFTLGVMLVLTLLETSNALPLGHIRNINKDCKPILSDSTASEDDYKQIECAISTCRNVSRVVYERENTQSYFGWIPVFEGYSDNNFHALDANLGDTLNHRTDYTVFPNKHLLYIEPLRHDDQGKWRCVVYGSYQENYASEAVEVMVHVPPKDNNFNITPSTAYLVTGQASEFTCIADGVNPAPNVTWYVNGEEHRGGIAMNNKQRDGLWLIKNTIQLAFDKEGFNVLSCIIKTDSRNPWLQTKAAFDIKETARITNPREALSIDVDLKSTFTLNCSGSGYRPIMKWQRNGVDILDNDERYSIKKECDAYWCNGSLTPATFDPNQACTERVYTAGEFTCVMSLGKPFQSLQVSPTMTSYMSHAMICSGKEVYMWTILVFAVLILLMVLAFVCIRENNRYYSRLRQNSNEQFKTVTL